MCIYFHIYTCIYSSTAPIHQVSWTTLWIYVCLHIYTYVFIYINVYIHTYVYTFIYILVYIAAQRRFTKYLEPHFVSQYCWHVLALFFTHWWVSVYVSVSILVSISISWLCFTNLSTDDMSPPFSSWAGVSLCLSQSLSMCLFLCLCFCLWQYLEFQWCWQILNLFFMQ